MNSAQKSDWKFAQRPPRKQAEKSERMLKWKSAPNRHVNRPRKRRNAEVFPGALFSPKNNIGPFSGSFRRLRWTDFLLVKSKRKFGHIPIGQHERG